MAGVLACVITGRDLDDAGLGTIPPLAVFTGRNGQPMFSANMPALAATRVRYVGEPVAVVVAETVPQALDAAEAVAVEYRHLPAVSDVTRAMAQDAPQIWQDAPGNIVLDWEDGDAAAVEAAFAHAAHVERVRLLDTRLAPTAMEPRAALATYDPRSQRYTLIAPTQGVAVVRKILTEAVFKVPTENIRVLTHDVGGGFGMKVQTYPEYAALLFAARRTGRPVRWRASGLESFLADTHGRDGLLEGELRWTPTAASSASARARSWASAPTRRPTSRSSAPGTRRTASPASMPSPAIYFNAKMVVTNTAPLGPYRGAGRPEAIYLIERLIDAAARSMNIDRVELRRRNFIAPSAMPYKTPVGPIYDSGDFAAMLDKALAKSDWSGFPAAAPPRSATASCAASASAASWRSRGAFSTKPSTCASSPTDAWLCEPVCRPWARDTCRRSCRWWPGGSASIPAPCACSSRATATRCRSVPRASRRAPS